MSDAFFYNHGAFAPDLRTAWERFEFETRYETDQDQQLAVRLNHESTRGTQEQVDNVFR